MRTRTLAALAALLLVPARAALGDDVVPERPPSSWIVDAAGLVSDAERAALDELQRRVEKERGVRLCVLTIPASRGLEPKQIAVQALNRWHAGKRSALLLVVLDPRKLYVQPGDELAQALSQGPCSEICAGTVGPKLREGDRAGALRAGLEAILARLPAPPGAPPELPAESPEPAIALEAPGPEPAPPPAPDSSSGTASVGANVCCCAVPIIAVVGLVAAFGGRKCPACSKKMSYSQHVVRAPTQDEAGQREEIWSCVCGHRAVTLAVIASLADQAAAAAASSSDSSSSSSDSSSSGSGSDSSSSGSGGGGSDW